MITIISGTNSNKSISLQLADIYHDYLQSKGLTSQVLDLREMPTDIIGPNMYHDRPASFVAFQEQYLVPADKFVVVLPEYNGGIPGIFKLMLDVSDIERCYYGKKACITGLSAGRAGNARGLDTLTNIFHYLRMGVFHFKLPISRSFSLMDENQKFTHQPTIELMKEQMDQFVAF
ncbi:MAG: NAD(P)H-dependent oxidoreductase [Bacteroidota bacterium]